jgi:hypothetical protein
MIGLKKHSGWLLTALFLLLCVMVNQAGAEMLPSGLQSWSDTLGNHETQMGGRIHNYQQDDSTWTQINNNWEVRDDTSYKNVRGLLKTYASGDGRCQIRVNISGHSIIIEQSLVRLVFLDTLEYRHEDLVTDLVWGEPVMDGRDLTWGFNHWSYRIRKGRGAVGNQIAFNPQALDWIVSQWEGLPAGIQAHAALANVLEYEITVDGEPLSDSLFLNDSLSVAKQLWKHGRKVLSLSRQNLYMGADHQLPVPVRQHWFKRGGAIYCAEYVMMPEIDSVHTLFPNKVLWHAATTTFNYTKMEDAYISQNAQQVCLNYGKSAYVKVRDVAIGGDYVGLTRPIDVAANIGAGQVIDSAELWYPQYGNSVTSDSVGIYECFKPWVEGIWDGEIPPNSDSQGVLWQYWQGYKTLKTCTGDAWATSGAACARDGGEYNNYGFNQDCVDSTADRKETREDMIYVHIDSTWLMWRISGDLFQDYYDGTKNTEGFVMLVQGSGEINFVSSSRTWSPNSAPDMPYYVVYHHDAAPPDIRHSPDGAGVRHSPDGVSVRHRP